MRKTLLTLFALLLLPAVTLAQWDFESVFPPNEDLQSSSAHGIAVDGEGKIWVQYFGATDSVQVPELNNEWQPTRVIYVFNPDGSEADVSPIKFVDLPGGETDTLGGFVTVDQNGNKIWEGRSGRGLATDPNGDILVAQWKTLYRINHITGEGMNKAQFDDYCSLTAPASDINGNVYVAPVCPGPPLQVLDEDFNFVENAIDATVGFSRSFAVSPDGNTIYWAGYTNNAVVEYSRPDEFQAYDSVGVVIPGMDSESFGWNPSTGHLWVAAGSPNDQPNDLEGFETNWQVQTWYAFDTSTFEVDTVPTPMDSLSWKIGDGASDATDGRPRGIAFSPDGDVVYVIQFNQAAPSVEKFLREGGTAIEPVDSELPASIELKQNYPNPFNPSTTIRFAVKEAGHVSLRVFNALGREVSVLVDEQAAPGTYDVRFEGRDLASGTYLYVLEAEGQRLSKTMLLVK